MAINFTDSPSNGATQTISGRTYTYNSTKNKWDTTATEVTGPTATVYASVDNLPTSGNITGSQAFVSSTNRLYIWNGSGWYNIALINNTPTISGASSSYALAIDGTATTVTLTATDPEGLPITYSIASDTSGNIATVAQGTGSNTNVFTITPSTNIAHAGTFSLTFRASDGVNLATAVSSFTLQFIVQNQQYTTALITTSGSAGTNNAFTDSSSNSHTVTANGDAAQTTFSPYRHGGYSTYFDGSGDYIELPNAAGSAASDTFTVEFWVKDPEVVSGSAPFYTQGSGSSNAAFAMDWTGTAIRIDYYGNNISHTVDLADGAWHHIAATVNGTTGDRKLWLNGSLVASDQNTNGTFSATNCVIGRMPWASRVYKGFMRDFRISDNIRYSATFTPPEAPFVSDSNTKILTCHLPYIADGSTNNHAITINGNTSTQPFAPYDAQEYATGSHGGSVYLDGTGDYLDVTSSAANLGTGDFTVECWAYWSADPRSIIYDTRQSDGNSGHAIFMTSTTHNVVFYDNNATVLTSAGAVKQGIWNHIAVVRNSGTINIFINGKKDTAQVTGNTTDFDAHAFRIGEKTYGGIPNVTGNITDFRISSSLQGIRLILLLPQLL